MVSKEKRKKILDSLVEQNKISKEEADELKKFELIERSGKQYVETDYPDPLNRFYLAYEIFQNSIEEMYFWILNHLRDDLGFTEVDKIKDIFAASEQSAFFGASQQRLGIQQDRISQFLATIGKMVKELFQLVRELRIIDERLDLYIRSDKGDNAAEISLKGYWIDLVEGGSKNPASVYGMATQVGFATLPDLFFAAPAALKSEDVDKYVDKLDYNRKVKEVLKRKLKTFLVWKEQTRKEIDTRRKFTIKYLRQHFVIIKTYMSWVKPYLTNVKRMTLDESRMLSADLIGAFEGSVVEIEILCKGKKEGKYYPIILAHWFYRTRPSMSYQQEGYQRGPIHVGRAEMTLRCYSWSEDQINAYEKLKDEEDLELIGSIDESLREAMDALGDDLKKYLEESGEKFVEEEVKEEKKPTQSMLEPFTSVFKGFAELGKAFIPEKKSKKEKRPSKLQIEQDKENKKKAGNFAIKQMYQAYKNYKKAHGFVHW